MRNAIYIVMALICLAASSCKEPPAPLPTANFFVEGSGCSSSCKVYFYDQSLNAVKWQWDFGNGIISNNQDDSTLYTSSGFYTVRLYVWNTDNVKDSVSKTVTVN